MLGGEHGSRGAGGGSVRDITSGAGRSGTRPTSAGRKRPSSARRVKMGSGDGAAHEGGGDGDETPRRRATRRDPKQPASVPAKGSEAPHGSKYHFSVIGGNHSYLVREGLQRRSWWVEVPSGTPAAVPGKRPPVPRQTARIHPAFNFLWRSGNFVDCRHSEWNTDARRPQMVNHFEFIKPLCTKSGLLRSLSEYYRRLGMAPWRFIPPTHILLSNRGSGVELHNFKKRFGDISKGLHKDDGLSPKMNDQNVWIVKPVDDNQGRGIELYNNMQQIMTHVNSKGETGTEWVVQKYIERPMLIDQRKFDVRVWALVDSDFNVYVYREGYLRTSSERYTFDLSKSFVHLTNYCLQKHSDNLGKHEDGNTLSFEQFQRYLDSAHPEAGVNFRKHLWPRMKECVVDSIIATRHRLNSNDRPHVFELFGYDFLLDEDFRVWLLEVNTNPFLGAQNDWHAALLPKMIDDMLKLTADKSFPRPADGKYESVTFDNPHHPELPGIEENMWDLTYTEDPARTVIAEHSKAVRGSAFPSKRKRGKGRRGASSPSDMPENPWRCNKPFKPPAGYTPPAVSLGAAHRSGTSPSKRTGGASVQLRVRGQLPTQATPVKPSVVAAPRVSRKSPSRSKPAVKVDEAADEENSSDSSEHREAAVAPDSKAPPKSAFRSPRNGHGGSPRSNAPPKRPVAERVESSPRRSMLRRRREPAGGGSRSVGASEDASTTITAFSPTAKGMSPKRKAGNSRTKNAGARGSSVTKATDAPQRADSETRDTREPASSASSPKAAASPMSSMQWASALGPFVLELRRRRLNSTASALTHSRAAAIRTAITSSTYKRRRKSSSASGGSSADDGKTVSVSPRELAASFFPARQALYILQILSCKESHRIRIVEERLVPSIRALSVGDGRFGTSKLLRASCVRVLANLCASVTLRGSVVRDGVVVPLVQSACSVCPFAREDDVHSLPPPAPQGAEDSLVDQELKDFDGAVPAPLAAVRALASLLRPAGSAGVAGWRHRLFSEGAMDTLLYIAALGSRTLLHRALRDEAREALALFGTAELLYRQATTPPSGSISHCTALFEPQHASIVAAVLAEELRRRGRGPLAEQKRPSGTAVNPSSATALDSHDLSLSRSAGSTGTPRSGRRSRSSPMSDSATRRSSRTLDERRHPSNASKRMPTRTEMQRRHNREVVEHRTRETALPSSARLAKSRVGRLSSTNRRPASSSRTMVAKAGIVQATDKAIGPAGAWRQHLSATAPSERSRRGKRTGPHRHSQDPSSAPSPLAVGYEPVFISGKSANLWQGTMSPVRSAAKPVEHARPATDAPAANRKGGPEAWSVPAAG